MGKFNSPKWKKIFCHFSNNNKIWTNIPLQLGKLYVDEWVPSAGQTHINDWLSVKWQLHLPLKYSVWSTSHLKILKIIFWKKRILLYTDDHLPFVHDPHMGLLCCDQCENHSNKSLRFREYNHLDSGKPNVNIPLLYTLHRWSIFIL